MSLSDTSERKTALVTGTNKGLGLEIARGLGQRGYEVWIGSRDRERGETAVAVLAKEGLSVRLLVLDVADAASIEGAVSAFSENAGHLDVLVNNAGLLVGRDDPPSKQSIDDLRTTYEANVFGPIRVTQAFLPLLKAADGARVVMMSGGVASLALITDSSSIYSTVNLLAYSSSKTALNAVTVAFAKELEPLGIKVNAVEPGNAATDLNDNVGMLTAAEGAASAIRLATIGKGGPTGGFFGIEGPRQPW